MSVLINEKFRQSLARRVGPYTIDLNLVRIGFSDRRIGVNFWFQPDHVNQEHRCLKRVIDYCVANSSSQFSTEVFITSTYNRVEAVFAVDDRIWTYFNLHPGEWLETFSRELSQEIEKVGPQMQILVFGGDYKKVDVDRLIGNCNSLAEDLRLNSKHLDDSPLYDIVELKLLVGRVWESLEIGDQQDKLHAAVGRMNTVLEQPALTF